MAQDGGFILCEDGVPLSLLPGVLAADPVPTPTPTPTPTPAPTPATMLLEGGAGSILLEDDTGYLLKETGIAAAFSDLPDAGSLSLTDRGELVRGGLNLQFTLSDLIAYIQG